MQVCIHDIKCVLYTCCFTGSKKHNQDGSGNSHNERKVFEAGKCTFKREDTYANLWIACWYYDHYWFVCVGRICAFWMQICTVYMRVHTQANNDCLNRFKQTNGVYLNAKNCPKFTQIGKRRRSCLVLQESLRVSPHLSSRSYTSEEDSNHSKPFFTEPPYSNLKWYINGRCKSGSCIVCFKVYGNISLKLWA